MNTSRMERDVEKFYCPLLNEYHGVEGIMDREKKGAHYMEEKIKWSIEKKNQGTRKRRQSFNSKISSFHNGNAYKTKGKVCMT